MIHNFGMISIFEQRVSLRALWKTWLHSQLDDKAAEVMQRCVRLLQRPREDCSFSSQFWVHHAGCSVVDEKKQQLEKEQDTVLFTESIVLWQKIPQKSMVWTGKNRPSLCRGYCRSFLFQFSEFAGGFFSHFQFVNPIFWNYLNRSDKRSFYILQICSSQKFLAEVEVNIYLSYRHQLWQFNHNLSQ